MVGTIMVPVEDDRPANITPIDLGQRGVDQFRSAMMELGPLSSYVAGFINNQGLCFAPLEENTTLKQALDFRSGMWAPTYAIRTWLANYIVKNWGAGCQLVFGDGWMRKSTALRRPPDFPFFFVDGTPCYAPNTGDMPTRFNAGRKKTGSHGSAAFVVAPPVALPPTAGDMTPQQKTALAQNIRAILLFAYDAEGYVIWQKQK